jgi:hypothetical protein
LGGFYAGSYCYFIKGAQSVLQIAPAAKPTGFDAWEPGRDETFLREKDL